MNSELLSVREVSAHYKEREVFGGVSFTVQSGHSLGVLGPNGAGKTTLLRMLVGCITPTSGEVRIEGGPPRDALWATGVGYFAGAATLPPWVRAAAWGTLGNGDPVTTDRRPIRVLSHGSKQLLGLRTVLSQRPLRLIVLDEPWEGLDQEGARWLSTTLESKRDRGAAIVVSSHRLHDLAGFCDAYLFLMRQQAVVLHAHEIARAGPVTAALLADVFDRVRERTDTIVRQPVAATSSR